jgi:hypothetical protein
MQTEIFAYVHHPRGHYLPILKGITRKILLAFWLTIYFWSKLQYVYPEVCFAKFWEVVLLLFLHHGANYCLDITTFCIRFSHFRGFLRDEANRWRDVRQLHSAHSLHSWWYLNFAQQRVIKELSLTSPIRFDGRQLGACERAVIRFLSEVWSGEATDNSLQSNRTKMARIGTNLVKVKSTHIRIK